MGMQITTARNMAREAKARIEGPTRPQALKMAATRRQYLTQAADPNIAPDVAFRLDCDAWDLEVALTEYGFDPETGKPVR